MAGRLPGRHKIRFEQAHSAHIQEIRPQWDSKQTKRCLEFLWYTVLSHEQKRRYDGKQETPFEWKIPHAVPPAYKKNRENEQTRKDFLRDLLNDPSTYTAPEEDGEAHTENASGENAEEHGSGEGGSGQQALEEHGSEYHSLEQKGSGEEGPTGGGSEGGPSAPDPAQTNRIEDLEAQITELRKDNALLNSNARERRHWPNLAHIPSPPSTDGDDNDPTGHLSEPFPIQRQYRVRSQPGRKGHSRDPAKRNEDELALHEAVNYERMVNGEIEARDGKEVLNHDGGIWTFHRMLGKGGFGKVALWRKTTESGVVDTVAVKEEEARAQWLWTDPLRWRDGLPIEISIHEHLKKINPPCPYLMSLRGYRLNLRQRRWRLYLPYKPGLTLQYPMDLRETWKEEYEIPLDFIFYTFLAMAEACLALDYGWWGGEENEPPAEEVEKTGGRKAGWIPIVHRDIKPGNVFLDSEPYDDEARWNMYPTPCVGDMGLAFEAYPDDPYNPENYVDSGTTLYMAPEQRDHRPFGVPFARELSDRTNVFAIAVSIFQLWQKRLPGFEASEFPHHKSEESSRLPPNHHVNDQLRKLYHYNDGLLARYYGNLNDNVLGVQGTSHWVHLWELEKWKSEWLLQKTHKSVKRRSGHKWVSVIEEQPLQGAKEVKLASILRQCLEWDTDDRPSILKLRNMVKDAIEELDINPSGDDERMVGSDFHGVRDPKGNLLPLVWRKGGLIFPMDDKEGSLNYLKVVGDGMEDAYKADKKKGFFELARRAMIRQLLPTQSNKNGPGNEGHPNNEPGDAVAEGTSKKGGGVGSKRKRVGSERSSKRQKSLSDELAEEAGMLESSDP